MKTKVFIYKGIIGIDSNSEAEGLIAKPGNGNLGCVCDASKIEFQKEALEVLKGIPKGRGGLGEIDSFKADKQNIFGWLGGYKKMFKADQVETSRDYDTSFLVATEGVEPTQEFIKFIDGFDEEPEDKNDSAD